MFFIYIFYVYLNTNFFLIKISIVLEEYKLRRDGKILKILFCSNFIIFTYKILTFYNTYQLPFFKNIFLFLFFFFSFLLRILTVCILISFLELPFSQHEIFFYHFPNRIFQEFTK